MTCTRVRYADLLKTLWAVQVSTVSPDGSDFSVILETGHAHCPVCSANNAPAAAANTTQTVPLSVLVSRLDISRLRKRNNKQNKKLFTHLSVIYLRF